MYGKVSHAAREDEVPDLLTQLGSVIYSLCGSCTNLSEQLREGGWGESLPPPPPPTPTGLQLVWTLSLPFLSLAMMH